MADAPADKLCIHTATTRPLSIELAVDAYAAAGVAGITVWRDALSRREPVAVGERIRGAGLTTALPPGSRRKRFYVSIRERSTSGRAGW